MCPSTANGEEPKGHIAVLFDKDHRRATLLASVPWFLQDLSTYGIGIFTPVILAADHRHRRCGDAMCRGSSIKCCSRRKGTAMLDVLLIVGILAAILLVERAGRIKLQIFGFIGCAVGPWPGRTLAGRRRP